MPQQAREKRKLDRLRMELAKGDADLAAGRKIVVSNDAQLRQLFSELNDSKKRPRRVRDAGEG